MRADDITIRMGVTLDEIDDLYELEKRIYRKDMMWSKREFKQLVLKGYTWVAEERGLLVGLIIINLQHGIPSIDTIEVAPEARGKGIAGWLMDRGEAEMADLGFDEMRLEVGSDNPAKDIYLRRGYHVVRIEKDYYSKGHHALLMSIPIRLIEDDES